VSPPLAVLLLLPCVSDVACLARLQLCYYLLNNKKMERALLSTDGIDINSWEISFSEAEQQAHEG